MDENYKMVLLTLGVGIGLILITGSLIWIIPMVVWIALNIIESEDKKKDPSFEGYTVSWLGKTFGGLKK